MPLLTEFHAKFSRKLFLSMQKILMTWTKIPDKNILKIWNRESKLALLTELRQVEMMVAMLSFKFFPFLVVFLFPCCHPRCAFHFSSFSMSPCNFVADPIFVFLSVLLYWHIAFYILNLFSELSFCNLKPFLCDISCWLINTAKSYIFVFPSKSSIFHLLLSQ